MTEYNCLDCGNEMEYEGGLFWNNTMTECFYGYKCVNCGSRFEHRLSKEEEEELKKQAEERRRINLESRGKRKLLSFKMDKERQTPEEAVSIISKVTNKLNEMSGGKKE